MTISVINGIPHEKLLVGLVGKARVGKDTAACHLRKMGLGVYAFADPLKDMLEVGFGNYFRSEYREDPIDWLGKSPRELMQTLGTEWGRDLIHPDLWVLMAHQRWLKTLESEERYGLTLSDVRFNNEAQWILDQGGLLIEIVRPDKESVRGHRSETAMTLAVPMVRVVNDGTVGQLQKAVDKAVNAFIRRGYKYEVA